MTPTRGFYAESDPCKAAPSTELEMSRSDMTDRSPEACGMSLSTDENLICSQARCGGALAKCAPAVFTVCVIVGKTDLVAKERSQRLEWPHLLLLLLLLSHSSLVYFSTALGSGASVHRFTLGGSRWREQITLLPAYILCIARPPLFLSSDIYFPFIPPRSCLRSPALRATLGTCCLLATHCVAVPSSERPPHISEPIKSAGFVVVGSGDRSIIPPEQPLWHSVMLLKASTLHALLPSHSSEKGPLPETVLGLVRAAEGGDGRKPESGIYSWLMAAVHGCADLALSQSAPQTHPGSLPAATFIIS
ncbi:hypothetical protein JZ751_018711 [Albula glossodonta]|uniref:Uncharacterized protein n=1 Tax=Albula glossodonta TaxID=121402 RepID=A0A8T2NVX5_9TELE|nr:hypothetical protein JZ751_018711 [Albula glossodonta]